MLSHASAQAQREQLQRDGFAIFPDVLSRQETARLSYSLELSGNSPDNQPGRELLAHPIIFSLAADSRLTAIVYDLLGPDLVPFRATLFGGPRGLAWKMVWHQDVTLPMRCLREGPGWGPWRVKAGLVHAQAPASALAGVVSLRLPLGSVPAENGPLRVFPGTHLLGVLDDAELGRLAKERVAMHCLAPYGGILAMKPLLIHSGTESLPSPSPPMLAIDYATQALVADGLALPA